MIGRRSHSEIDRIPGITNAEIKALKTSGITSAVALWTLLGKDAERGHASLAKDAGLAPARLTELLSALVLDEAHTYGKPWHIRHFPDLLCLAALVIFVGLLLRSLALLPLPARFRLQTQVPVAARAISRGETVRDEDISGATLPDQPTYFKSRHLVTGTVLDRPLAKFQPFQTTDVIRAQVISSRDLPANSVIDGSVVALAWTPYDERALSSVAEVIGRRTVVAIRSGQIVLPIFISGR
jgi:hypothetical protein